MFWIEINVWKSIISRENELHKHYANKKTYDFKLGYVRVVCCDVILQSGVYVD